MRATASVEEIWCEKIRRCSCGESFVRSRYGLTATSECPAQPIAVAAAPFSIRTSKPSITQMAQLKRIKKRGQNA
ncbi:hypothetical protein [Bradyrhizobium sp. UFLA05-112]